MANAVLEAFHDWGLSWGMAIILLTIVTRALLIPLTYKQLKSMRALQAFQPQIKALQEKYKNDRQRLSQEMMKFYQENKINPLASCIPLLAQMPIFITLFYTLRGPLREDMCGQTAKSCGEVLNTATGQLGGFGENFLIIPDLTAKATGSVLIILMVLYVGTQLVSGLITATTADKNQRIMMLVLPFIFIPFIISFPAGLVLYWITTNFWTIGQQYVVNKVIPPPVIPSPAEAAVAKAPPPPPRKKKRRR
ncbi:MAG: YidC/Oxa1 family membrane protein insertase [Actinomycetota bacterium]|nr:YidC/Oxa1 family membrane protein insertase [Actinomycetota bacterium]